MPRFVVERTFPQGLTIPLDAGGQAACMNVVGRNAELGVSWVISYVGPDNRKTFCVYDGPSADAVREAAARNGLPVDAVTPVRVLDPYFYRPES
jgi:hypothetical protein